MPGPADVAGVSQPVLLDVDAQVAGVQIAEGGELIFDPAASRTLTSTGNVVVAGALRARPADASVHHRVAFAGIDESRFVGSHTMAPIDSDVGLWVVTNGVLDLVGTPKKAWTNLASGADAGDATITVADASGWLPGDEIVVTPTESTQAEGFAERQDRRVVQSVDGGQVTLDQPLEFAHPAVTVREGVTHTAEVLNLTRNVAVEGAPEGRAHVILLDIKAPQTISHVGLRHLGPQQAWTGDEGETGVQGVKGRYSLHFHMSHDATRGSVVDSVVAYDGGNHSFVPHLSHGITFRDCVAHDQAQSAFWWDPAEGEQDGGAVPTHDLLYERCVASHINTTDATEYETSGFVMGAGEGNVARGCVAVGLLGSDEANPGYGWHPASAGGVWTFEDNLAHNNEGSSIYFWINNTPPTLVDRFTGYHDRHGIRAGSYTNLVSYRDTTVYGCLEKGILVVAVPGAPEEQPDLTVTYENVYVDQAGLTEYAFEIGGHVVDTTQVTRVVGCEFRGGHRGAGRLPRGRRVPAALRVHRLHLRRHGVLPGRRPDRGGRHPGARRGARRDRPAPGRSGRRAATRVERGRHRHLTGLGVSVGPVEAGGEVAHRDDVEVAGVTQAGRRRADAVEGGEGPVGVGRHVVRVEPEVEQRAVPGRLAHPGHGRRAHRPTGTRDPAVGANR